MFIKRFIQDTRRYAGYALYAARADMKSEVNSSYLSWLWLILDPFFFMLIYTFIVTVVFGSSEPYLPVFVFIGLSAWNFFSRCVTGSLSLVRSYKGVISKVYVPKFVFLYVRILTHGLKMLISFAIVAGMLVAYRVPLSWNILYFFPLIILLMAGTFGISSILMHFGTFVDDLSNVVGILMRLMFYLSGVFYSIRTRVPLPYGPMLAYYNPVAYVIDEFRNVLLFGQPLYFKWYFAWLLVSLLLSAAGVWLIYRYESRYAKVI